METETVYSSGYAPNPGSALDVLAFLLTPARAFVADPSELDEVAELLGEAKAEAYRRWYELANQTEAN